MNKKTLLPLASALLMLASQYSYADNISLSVGQPGFFGHIDIGGYPAPQLVYPQPVVVQPAPYGAPPMYLYAPPDHIHHWKKYCHHYNACGAPVYFVQERWYNEVYVPQYRHGHGYDYDHHDHHHDHDHDDDDHDDHHHHHHDHD